jgi:glycosyltransferase involved in cell wall biosynthesis
MIDANSKKNMKLGLSVLIAVYEGEKPDFLEQCLRSLENQTLKANEVVLVEDGIIPLELKSIIETFRTKLNIRSLILDNNVGLAGALNAGLKVCNHNLIARMDSDDISLPERLETQLKVFNGPEAPDVLGAYAQEIDAASQKGRVRRVPSSHSEIYSCLYASPFIHPTIVFKKSSIEKLGGYNEGLRRRQDYDLWFRAAKSGLKFRNIPEVLLLYRFDKSSHRKQSRSMLFQQGLIGLNGVRMVGQPIWKGFLSFVPFARGLLPHALQHNVYNFLKKFDPRERAGDEM